MSKKYYIGLDNGGSFSKAGLYDESGREIATAGENVPIILPRPGFVERDTAVMFEANARCIQKVLNKSGVNGKDVAGVSVTGHGNGVYLMGKDKKPSYNGIISTDSRAARYVEQWQKNGTFLRVLDKTMQSLWAGQTIPILAWLKEHEPEAIAKTAYAFSCTDAVRYFLTGEAWGEVTNMSSISAMNLLSGEYDPEVLDAFGISDMMALLPPVRQSSDICGYITREAANLTGLLKGTPVAGGLVDFAACPIATGVCSGDILSLVEGTWVIACAMADAPVKDPDLFMSFLYPLKSKYGIMEGSMTSASNLEWFTGCFMEAEKQQADKKGISVYKVCDEIVASIMKEDSEIIFLPYLYGTNTNSRARGCFEGLSYAHEKKHLIRAVYEGVVFSTMHHVERLINYRQQGFKTVRISGGPSRSSVWVQMFADALGIPVEISAAKELGTMGGAMCAAVATGRFADFKQASETFLKIESVCEPNPEMTGVYKQRFARYKKLVNAMERYWADVNNQ